MECDECGYVYEDLAATAIATAISELGPRYAVTIAGADPALLAQRPDPSTWSALEYSCHVRDVLFVLRDRLILALVETCPNFAPMYRDQRPELTGYAEEQPATVVSEIQMAGALFARLYDRLTPEHLARPCIYNFPAPAEVDLVWLGRHTVHEGVHHLGDVSRVLREVA